MRSLQTRFALGAGCLAPALGSGHRRRLDRRRFTLLSLTRDAGPVARLVVEAVPAAP